MLHAGKRCSYRLENTATRSVRPFIFVDWCSLVVGFDFAMHWRGFGEQANGLKP